MMLMMMMTTTTQRWQSHATSFKSMMMMMMMRPSLCLKTSTSLTLTWGLHAGEEPAPHEAQLEALGGASDGEAGLREAWYNMSSSAHGELLRSALSSLSSNYVLQRGGV